MRLSEFLKEERGVSSVEYALLASLIAVVCVAIVAAVGLNTLNLYTVVCNGVAAPLAIHRASRPNMTPCLPNSLPMLDLVGMLVASPRTGVLIGLLVFAAVGDIQTGRIPNWLVLIGTIYAVAFSAFYPVYPRDMGLLFALGGFVVGFALLLPGYLLRVLGAGDVKLMAMVGAFLGTWAAVEAVLASLIAGGLLALALAAYSGRLSLMFATSRWCSAARCSDSARAWAGSPCRAAPPPEGCHMA